MEVERRLHDLLSTPENDLDYLGFMEIGRVHKSAPAHGTMGPEEDEFAHILRLALYWAHLDEAQPPGAA